MRKLYFLLLFLINGSLWAQDNYVATSPASPSPGGDNVIIGVTAGNGISTARQSTVVGRLAGYSVTSGSGNTFMGYRAGYYTEVGYFNTFLGDDAGFFNSTGIYNTYVGAQTGQYNTSGSNNAIIGYQAGFNTTTGYANVIAGVRAGNWNTDAHKNVMIGDSAGFNNRVSEQVMIGSKAGFTNQSGAQNTFLGYQTGYNASSSANTFVGYKAGFSTTNGANNTFMGQQAGYNVTSGSNNIIIGPASGTAITDGSNNVLMGYNSQVDKGIFNGIALGSNSRVARSNSLILGNHVNVGIGTSAPQRKLEVIADEAETSGLRLTKLTSQSKTDQSTDQFLTVNEKGDVIKARYQLRISRPTEWSDNVFLPTYTLRSLTSVEKFIHQHGHLPNVPSAAQVFKEGINLVKINATLLEKVEELTLYSIQLEKNNQHLLQRDRHLEAEAKKQQSEIDELKKLMKRILQKK